MFSYAATTREYRGTNGAICDGLTFLERITDYDSIPSSEYNLVLAEVCARVAKPDPSGHGFYPVFSDQPRGDAGYCGWHSSGVCKGVKVRPSMALYLWKRLSV